MFDLRRWWLLGLMLMLGCSHQTPSIIPVAEVFSYADIQRGLQERLGQPAIDRIDRDSFALVQSFYRQREFRPVWHSAGGTRLSEQAVQLRQALAESRRHGLEPTSYHYAELLRLCDSPRLADRVRLELLLTDAFLRYASHLYEGQTRPEKVDLDWHIRGEQLDAPVYLRQALLQEDFAAQLAALAPPHRGYQKLAQALARYRQLAELGGWPMIEQGPLLRPGDRALRVETLRWRLWLEGHLTDMSVDDPYYFDATLEQAVRRFQQLHTLAVDGMVGGDTLAALNVPVEARITQLLLNLERWRWLPRELHHRYLLVNMAGYELSAYDKGEPVLNMRVIIGKPYRSTPAFSGGLTHVVINPTWNVPRRITEEDLIPAQVADPDYLRARNIRVLKSWRKDAIELDPAEIPWEQYLNQDFPYRLRQDAGPMNSLGRIKFMLSNPFSIYLHDTPSRHLFEQSVRTFSSGCIRVEQPLALALFLFDGVEDWSAQQLQDRIDSGETQTELLPGSIPVYLVYLTAWVDDRSGELHFADDIYARDSKLASKLPIDAIRGSRAN